MSESRISAFESMAINDPGNVMVWYGLGTEYSKIERWRDAATAFTKVLELNPDYTSAYQLLGTALLKLGESAAASAAWTEGIAAAERTGAWKAREHMNRLLSGLEPPKEFCSNG